jgi:hypothetical protein
LRQFLIDVVGRPILLGLWLLALWGTLYGLALLYAAAAEGPVAAVRRTLSGEAPAVGAVNLTLAVVAMLVWGVVGAICWLRRSGPRPPRSHRGEGPHARS